MSLLLNTSEVDSDLLLDFMAFATLFADAAARAFQHDGVHAGWYLHLEQPMNANVFVAAFLD